MVINVVWMVISTKQASMAGSVGLMLMHGTLFDIGWVGVNSNGCPPPTQKSLNFA